MHSPSVEEHPQSFTNFPKLKLSAYFSLYTLKHARWQVAFQESTVKRNAA